jgi:hypothetical protein
MAGLIDAEHAPRTYFEDVVKLCRCIQGAILQVRLLHPDVQMRIHAAVANRLVV